jgi:hypothetical protein
MNSEILQSAKDEAALPGGILGGLRKLLTKGEPK